MKSPLVVLLAAGILSACNDPASVIPDDAEVRLVNPVVWPGQPIEVQSAAFRDLPDSSLRIVIADSAMIAARINDSTVSAPAPTTSGVHQFVVRLANGQRLRSGVVTVAGFAGAVDAPALGGWAEGVSPGHPVAIAVGESSLVRVDLRTGVVAPSALRHSGACAVSAGSSFRTGAVVSQSWGSVGCNYARLHESLSGPVLDSTPAISTHNRQVAELSPGLWVFAAHHWLMIRGTSNRDERVEETSRFVWNPDRSRLFPLSNNTAGGIPVLGTSDGALLFRLAIRYSQAGAYSSGGDTIFVSGPAVGEFDPQHIHAASAATGETLLDRTMDSLPVQEAMLLDPEGPWLFTVSAPLTNEGIRPTIYVFRRLDLELVASLTVPATVTCAGSCSHLSLAIDRQSNRLHLLEARNHYSFDPQWTSRLFHFRIVPVTQTAVVLSQ